MSIIDCFKNHGRPDLQKKFDEKVKGGASEYDAARDILLDEHKNLHDQTNEIRKELKIPEGEYKSSATTPPTTETTLPETTGMGETIGITHKQMDDVAKEFGWATYEKDPETVEGWDATATERLEKDPKAINKMLQRMRDGKIDDPVDQRMMIKYVSSLKARINEKPTKELLDELKRAKDVSNISGRMLGKGLVARKGEVAVEDTLADFLVDRGMDKGHQLTESQIKSESEKYNKLKSEKEKLEKTLEEERAQYSKMVAEYGVNKAKAIAKKASKKSHEEYAAERKGYIEAAREALKKSRGETSAVVIPVAKELVAIAPHVKKFMQSLANEGVDKLDNIVTAIHAEFKDVVDGLTKSQIIEIIGGQHDPQRETKSDKAAQLRLFKREAQLLTELADARKGIEKEKSEVKKDEKSRRIEELEKKIKEVRELNKEKLSEEKLDEKENAKRQEQLQGRIKKLQTDIRDKKYEPDKRPEPTFKKSFKTQQLEDRVIGLEKQLNHDRMVDRLAKRSKAEKTYDFVAREILGVRRLAQTILDWSILFRQLNRLAFNPRKWNIFGKAAAASFKTTFSQKKFDRAMNEVHKASDFKDMVDDGIRFNEFETNEVAKQNEFYYKNWLFKVPILKEIPLSSQRAADSALNIARAELYRKYAKNLRDEGITRQSDPKVYQKMAEEVMNQTASGRLAKGFEDNPAAQKYLGNTFYGARLMAATFNQLNPAYYAKMPKEVRGLIWKDIASHVVTLMATGAAFKYIGGYSISLNPNDPDFLQLRKGDKVYDITGGKAQYIRTALRILEAAYTQVHSHRNKEKAQAWEFAGKSTGSFFRNKLAPNTSDAYTWTFGQGKNSIGRKANPWEFTHIWPMYFDDAKKGFEEDGMLSLATTVMPNLLGIGYNSYYSDPAQQPLDNLLERNLRSEDIDFSKYKNYKEGGRPINDNEVDKFIDRRDEEIEKDIKKLHDKGAPVMDNGKVVIKPFNELTKEQIISETSSIKSRATSKVKEELFGKEKETSKDKKEDSKLSKERKKYYEN